MISKADREKMRQWAIHGIPEADRETAQQLFREYVAEGRQWLEEKLKQSPEVAAHFYRVKREHEENTRAASPAVPPTPK